MFRAVADVVESKRRLILRKIGRWQNVHAQQITHRIVVLGSVQAPGCDAALRPVGSDYPDGRVPIAATWSPRSSPRRVVLGMPGGGISPAFIFASARSQISRLRTNVSGFWLAVKSTPPD